MFFAFGTQAPGAIEKLYTIGREKTKALRFARLSAFITVNPFRIT